MSRPKLNKSFAAALLGLICALPAYADEGLLKPFILATTPAGTLEEVVSEVRASLKGQGFEEVGRYSPYRGATIIVVTSPELKTAAAKSEHGGFGAAQRVAVTDVKGKLQVSYTNPVYMAYANRMGPQGSRIHRRLSRTARSKTDAFQPSRSRTRSVKEQSLTAKNWH